MYLCYKTYQKKNIALAQDVVKAEIISHINGTIHATIDSPELEYYSQNAENVLVLL